MWRGKPRKKDSRVAVLFFCIVVGAASNQVVPEAEGSGQKLLKTESAIEKDTGTEFPASSESLWETLHELAFQLSAVQTSYVDNFEARLATRDPQHESESKPANPLARLGALRARAARELAFALHTSEDSDGALVAGRKLRKGVPTYVVTSSSDYLNGSTVWQSATANELWDVYRNTPKHQSSTPWASREALAPFLAYKTFRSLEDIKWVYVGPAFTLAFPEVLMSIVEGLDPEMPYFITDNIWWKSPGPWPQGDVSRHPHPEAPRCAPCGYAGNLSRADVDIPRGCPCTPDLLCKSHPFFVGKAASEAKDQATSRSGERGVPVCSVPREPVQPYKFHVPSGALLSVGLLRSIPFHQMEGCVKSKVGLSADVMLTECLWLAGVGITDPDPLYHPDGLTMFDPHPAIADYNDPIPPGLARVTGNLLRAVVGNCDAFCELEILRTATMDLSYTDSKEKGLIAVGHLVTALYRAALLGTSPESELYSLDGDRGGNAKVRVGTSSVLGPLGTALDVVKTSLEACPGSDREEIALRMSAVADTAAAQAIARDLLERVIHAQDAPEASASAPAPLSAPAEAKHRQGDTVM